MSQGDGTPPEDYEQRGDPAVRKAFGALKRLLNKIFEEKLKPYVTWSGFALSMVGFLSITALLVTTLGGPAKDTAAGAKEVAASAVVRVEGLEKKFEKVADDISGLKEAAAEQRVMYRVFIERKTKAQARAEVEQIEKEK